MVTEFTDTQAAELRRLAEAASSGNVPYVGNFFAKVRADGRCLVWTGAVSGRPGRMYGCFWNGKPIKAHRFAYETWNGPLIDGLLICHTCDNHRCVNPAHLYQGTASDNVRDAVARNRHGNGQAGKTHCPSGHPYVAENTYIYRSQRQCKTCRDIHRGRIPGGYF